jgi:hypothetical protein
MSTDFTPDPALVRALAAKIVDSAVRELRDTGAMDVSEICEDEIGPLADDMQDTLIRAVLDALRTVEITHRFPGEAA